MSEVRQLTDGKGVDVFIHEMALPPELWAMKTMNLPQPDINKAWFGYRPVSPDGMPYIGRHTKFSNLTYAGGHAMLGVTAAAGTGRLIEEIISGKNPSFDLEAFNPARFG